jgi:cobyrinic acid a,c-diamide synthase
MPPRVMVAAPQGRSGKTVVTTGLCALFRKAGITVGAFKKGPDYIDPSWLTAATGRACRNLDPFLMPWDVIRKSFQKAAAGLDLAVIEGNMGLYDSIEPHGEGSSAHLARFLETPVVLVVNTARMTRSVAAMVKGYQYFEPGTPVAGVILNNISGTRHRRKLIDAVQEYCGIPVVGAIPRDAGISVDERHLGLVPFGESHAGTLIIEGIARAMEGHVDLGAILAMAGRVTTPGSAVDQHHTGQTGIPVRIGIILDRAFHFYYPENLEALEAAGAQLVFIDSLKDRALPSLDGLYIGGGFPELYLEALHLNRQLMGSIASAIDEGLPVYAECAGLMYLCSAVTTGKKTYGMAGVLPAHVEFSSRPQGHGYVEAEVALENPFYPAGTLLRGHEFHFSRLHGAAGLPCALRMKRGQGIDGRRDGIVHKNLFASYTHIHALGTPQWAGSFVTLASKWRIWTNSLPQEYPKEVIHG